MQVIITVYCGKIVNVNAYRFSDDAEDHYYDAVRDSYWNEMEEEGVEDDREAILKHAEQHMIGRDFRVEWWETFGRDKGIKIDPIEWDQSLDTG